MVGFVFQVWAIIGAQFCQSVGMYGLLSWLPAYLHDARGLAADSPELGTLAAAPYAIQAREQHTTQMNRPQRINQPTLDRAFTVVVVVVVVPFLFV